MLSARTARCQPFTALSVSWWHHQMEIFSVLLAICAGNSPVTGEFPAQRPVTRSFHVFFDLCLNKQFCKQLRGWWFERPSYPLWRHYDVKLNWVPSVIVSKINHYSCLPHLCIKIHPKLFCELISTKYRLPCLFILHFIFKDGILVILKWWNLLMSNVQMTYSDLA